MSRHGAGSASASIDAAWHDSSLPVAERVQALISEMTLREKLAQLGSFWPRESSDEAIGDVAPLESEMGDSETPF